ncbi:MAG: DUF5684 domain-containing protein [Microbacterium sp.]|uniref:DUF5684 domain-containing protein n=1 Tax=Microbacterium sp. TaxID=51671 RepID=UPI0039E6BD45
MNDSGLLLALLPGLATIAIYVWVGLSLSAVFAKAGEQGWKAWVPFYNTAVLLQLGGMSGWLVLLVLVPVLGAIALTVVLVVAYRRINSAFGLGVGMTVLAALLFPVWSSVVGWGSARWLGAAAAPSLDTRMPPPPSERPPGVIPPRPPAPPAAAVIDAADGPFDDGGVLLGRSPAPFTQTSPTPPVQSAPPLPPDPWAPQDGPPVASRPTRFSPSFDPEAHFDTSADVSAVADAPVAAAPRSARDSVSAQQAASLPDELDETVRAARRRPAWSLVPPSGAPILITSNVVIVGRRPGIDHDRPHAQLVSIADETRTMSKTHARLERDGDAWTIVDLDSTNGVVLVGEDGVETDVTPRVPAPLTGRFLLGDAELGITGPEPENWRTRPEAR